MIWEKIRPLLLATTSTIAICKVPFWDLTHSSTVQLIFAISSVWAFLYWIFFCLDYKGGDK